MRLLLDPNTLSTTSRQLPDEAINSRSTLLDFVSHRIGLASKNALWQHNGRELLLDENDGVRFEESPSLLLSG